MYLDPRLPASPPPEGFGFARRAADKYIVASRYVGNTWPTVGPQAKAIERARSDYEAGLAEMATGRKGRMEYLYSIPRKRRGTERPGYFRRRGN